MFDWEESFTGKKLGELRNEFLQMFGETSRNKLYNLLKWLKFLFSSLKSEGVNISSVNISSNEGSSYLFEKFNWKFRINFLEIVAKSINEFLYP